MRSRLPLFLGLCLSASLAVSSCNTNRDVGADPEDRPGATDPGDPNKPGQPSDTLTVEPADTVINYDGKSPVTLAYTVKNKNGEDVTAQAMLTVDDSRFGGFQGAQLTLSKTAGGKTRVRARLGDEEGSTSLTVRTSVVVIAPGAPPDAPTKFGGREDKNQAPEIAYPPPGVLVPPNLNELEVHFLPKDGALFEVRFLGDAIDLRVYTKCNTAGSGCTLQTDDASWKWLSQTARNSTVQLSIRSSINDGATIGVSKAQALSFANEDMQGGLYYWAASIGGIARYDFGLRGQKAEAYYGPLQAAGVCVGCHAMSKNGKRIAVGMNIPGPALMRALDTGTKSKLYEVGVGLITGSNYQAWTPDGAWLITTETGGLTVRDGTSGAIKGNNPAVKDANMPDVSPDGKQVVFSRNKTPQCIGMLCQTLGVEGASIHTVAMNADQTFGAPQLLAAADGGNNYYPSFSPDSRFVAYNRAGGASYDAPDAKVMVIKASGGMPIDLTSVNDQVGNSWPKWSPFVHHFKAGTIMWLTFSSRRAYGVRPGMNAQIWMVPVDLAKLEKGQDSGYPPFRLPFQDLNTGNHIPSWVEKVQRKPCTPGEMSGCGANEQCVDGYCTPVIGLR